MSRLHPLTVLFASSLIVLFAACGDDRGSGGGGGGGTPSPAASEISEGEVVAFCETEDQYAENQVTDEDEAAFNCQFEIIFGTPTGADPVEFCNDHYQDCIADYLAADHSENISEANSGEDNATEEENTGEGTGEVENGGENGEEELDCQLADIDRNECDATLAEIRACERGRMNDLLEAIRGFTCADLGEEDDTEVPEGADALSAACRTVNNACPAYFGHQYPVDEPENQTEENQTEANQTEGNQQTNQSQTNQQNNQTETNQQNNQTTTNQQTGGNEQLGYGDMIHAVFYDLHVYYDAVCTCSPEMLEAPSEADCHAAYSFDAGGLPSVAACYEDLALNAATAPASVHSYVNCSMDVFEELEGCYDMLNPNDLCADTSFDAYVDCDGQVYAQLQACEGLVDAAGGGWIDDLNAAADANNCTDPIQ